MLNNREAGSLYKGRSFLYDEAAPAQLFINQKVAKDFVKFCLCLCSIASLSHLFNMYSYTRGRLNSA